MSTEIIIVRQAPAEAFEERDVAIFRNVLYGLLDGLNEQHKQRFRRFWNWCFRAQPGEMVRWEQKRERLSRTHRSHFLIEQRLLDSQDRFDDLRTFRYWNCIGAGHVSWVAGTSGGVVPIPKSMSYAELDEDGMVELHHAMLQFWRGPHAAIYLWPHLRKTPEKAAEMMESALMDLPNV